jgi:broad specificity phosphatase PhoE
MHVYFVRHGESTTNAASIATGQNLDPELTINGAEQAREAARWIQDNNIKFDLIIVSPTTRTLQTARIIARNLHYPVADILEWPDLIERGLGDYEGGPNDDYFQASEAVAVKEHGVEPLESMYERSQKVINNLNNKHPNKTVLIVAHNGTGKMLRIAVEGRDGEEFDRTVTLPNGNVSKLI